MMFLNASCDSAPTLTAAADDDDDDDDPAAAALHCCLDVRRGRPWMPELRPLLLLPLAR